MDLEHFAALKVDQRLFGRLELIVLLELAAHLLLELLGHGLATQSVGVLMVLHHREEQFEPLRNQEWRSFKVRVFECAKTGHFISFGLLSPLSGSSAVLFGAQAQVIVADFSAARQCLG